MERSSSGECSDRAARELLKAGLAELGLAAAPDQVETLWRLAGLVEHWARSVNLTAHRSLPAVVERLVLEAAALLPRLPPLTTLADLGSGAGFPGIPLAVLRPDWRVTLVEARERRHHFQRSVLRELRISNARAVRGRAEELEAELHDAVLAQAMGPPARTIGWMQRWARSGGWLLIPGGAQPPPVPACVGVEFVSLMRYRAPKSGNDRTLWIGRRL